MDETLRLAIARYADRTASGPELLSPELTRAEQLIGQLPDGLKHLYRACGNGDFGAGLRPLIFAGDPGVSLDYAFEEASVVGATLIEQRCSSVAC